MTECPDCEGDAELMDILGDVARPKGAVYRCKRCDNQLTDRDLLDDKWDACPGCGFPTHSEGAFCGDCTGGRI